MNNLSGRIRVIGKERKGHYALHHLLRYLLPENTERDGKLSRYRMKSVVSSEITTQIELTGKTFARSEKD